jgi:hypothetical protein
MHDDNLFSSASQAHGPSNGDSNDFRAADRAGGSKLSNAAAAVFSEAAFNAGADENPDLGKVLERNELSRKSRAR